MRNGGIEETLEHLFFSCPFSSRCWRFLHIVWNLQLDLFDKIVEVRQIFGKKFFRDEVFFYQIMLEA
jgi:hypothetical protein